MHIFVSQNWLCLVHVIIFAINYLEIKYFISVKKIHEYKYSKEQKKNNKGVSMCLKRAERKGQSGSHGRWKPWGRDQVQALWGHIHPS